MMNVWWNFTIVSCVANICDKFTYPVFDSIVFWYQINPRKLQILLKNHDAEGEDFLKSKKTKKGKRVIETTPRQDHDENVRRLANQKASDRKFHEAEMDAAMINSDNTNNNAEAGNEEEDDLDDDDHNIATSNARSSQVAQQAMLEDTSDKEDHTQES